MRKLIFVLALSFLIAEIQAQESIPSSGGEGSGDGGTLSYSVGQVAYGTHTGSSGSVSEGVQQAYEIFVIIGVDETGIMLNISAFPNPTTDYLILKIPDDAILETKFTISLYDLNGRIIKQQIVVSSETEIDMADLQAATYLLKIMNNHREIKTFKIIKTQ